MSVLQRLLSYAVPISAWQGEGRYGTLKLAYESGHLVVNSARANQSWGALHEVWQQCFTEERIAESNPGNVLILGFGAGSIASILRKELALKSAITGVDGDPVMLDLARRTFQIERLGRLRLVEMDAMEFLTRVNGSFDLVLVDLFHELDLAPGVDEADFTDRLAECTGPDGKLCFNTVAHDAPSEERSQRAGQNLRLAFNHLTEHRFNGMNRVFVATMPINSSKRPEI